MQQQYNKGLCFIDDVVGQKVENRKLATQRDGPWTILQKLPNGMNFTISNSGKEQKVVYHDHLLPVKEGELASEGPEEITSRGQPNRDPPPVSDPESSDEGDFSSSD